MDVCECLQLEEDAQEKEKTTESSGMTGLGGYCSDSCGNRDSGQMKISPETQ